MEHTDKYYICPNHGLKDCPCDTKEELNSWEEDYKNKFGLCDAESNLGSRCQCKKEINFIKKIIAHAVAEARADEAIRCEEHIKKAVAEERERIVKLIKEKGLHLGYKNNIIDLITQKEPKVGLKKKFNFDDYSD